MDIIGLGNKFIEEQVNPDAHRSQVCITAEGGKVQCFI